MAVLHIETPKGRDFTAEELVGRRIRIEGPVPSGKTAPIGCSMMVIADDEMVTNVSRLELVIAPNAVVEAKLQLISGKALTEEITLRDDIEVSFSAIVSEVKP
jgi:hypothetical protein